MYERDETDFDITPWREGSFVVSIGTWSNSDQGLADCLFYLSLNDQTRRERFLATLKGYDDLLQDKAAIVRDLQEKGINYHSVVNVDNFLDYLDMAEQGDGYRDVDEERLSEYVDAQRDRVIEALQAAGDIVEAYDALQELKEDFKDYIYDNYLEFSTAA